MEAEGAAEEIESLRSRLALATDTLRVLAEQTGESWTLDIVKTYVTDVLRFLDRMERGTKAP
jgi:hypothetical protein